MSAAPGVAVERFRARFGGTPHVFSAPGRVNLIGEHTDYNDGFVLPMAIGERTWVAAKARRDRVIRAYSLEQDEERAFSLDEPFVRRESWLDYVEGVARALTARGVPLVGAELSVASEVPVGAGLSSSAALELAVGLALSTLSGASLEPAELARVGQVAENDFAGVRSGVMDQLASALGREGHALFIDCRSLAVTPVPIPDDGVTFLIVDSGVKHAHAENGYNQRRDECQQAVELVRATGRSLDSLRDLGMEELALLEPSLPEPHFRRARHVVSENARTEQAARVLTRGELAPFGELMNASHASLRDDYEASAPELDHLVDVAQRQAGVLGARLTGGGFGGSALVLVQTPALERVSAVLGASYWERFRKKATFRSARASSGARAEPSPS
ncbi:MAG TPA: galactokinase [Polyangiaceae bacterium]|nr:galactokinase [Polyangiaceae bacterium]